MFADVELSGDDEADSLECLGLAIDPDEPPLLLQPCTALDGTRCGIYQHRPECCRTFECRTLQEAQREEISEVERSVSMKIEILGSRCKPTFLYKQAMHEGHLY